MEDWALRKIWHMMKSQLPRGSQMFTIFVAVSETWVVRTAVAGKPLDVKSHNFACKYLRHGALQGCHLYFSTSVFSMRKIVVSSINEGPMYYSFKGAGSPEIRYQIGFGCISVVIWSFGIIFFQLGEKWTQFSDIVLLQSYKIRFVFNMSISEKTSEKLW